MGLAINLVAALLVGFAVTTSALAPFPHGKTVVYNYYGDVKAGIIEPAAYASQFALEGIFYVQHDDSDPEVKNAYYVALQNITTGMHNGMAAHYQRTSTLKPIEDVAKVIEQPFMIHFDENGRLNGVKIQPSEAAWSKNMKMAIASMLQLDLLNMNVQQPMKPYSFISQESTIHGSCWINYDVHSKDPFHQSSNNEFIVTKFSSPKNCSGFAVNSFNHVDVEGCQAPSEEPVNVASRRVFEIENQGGDLIIKKLVAHGGSNYFPWNARSEAHYILTNTTFAIDRIVPVSEISLPSVNFKTVPITRDITYLKPEGNYATNAALDITQGRRVIELDVVIANVKKMLVDAANYIENNNLEKKEPDWRHGQTINRLLQEMGYMDVLSMENVFDTYKDSTTRKDITINNIFLGLVPQVGTTASALFTLNVIQHQKISTVKAIEMLHKLPLSIKVPSVELLTQMEALIRFGDSINLQVRKASILCFSSLIYRTFKNIPRPVENPHLQKYLHQFFNMLQIDSEYEMKVTYLMAIRNIEIGEIYGLLAPVIRGDIEISEKPMHIRLLAIWAINKAIAEDYHYAHDLLWPIMTDLSLPVKLRIAAYEILMYQAPTMTDVLHIYWFMVYERNEHLYNYHHMTIKGIANSVDPCNNRLRELVRKIMRFTRVHETIRYTLSNVFVVDYKDEKFNHAEKFHFGTVVNELTGIPEVLQFEHVITDARKPYSNFQIQLHVQGIEGIVNLALLGQVSLPGGLTNSNVLEILRKAAEKLPISKQVHVDIIVSHKGRVVLASHYNENTVREVAEDVKRYISQYSEGLKINSQHVYYDNLYEKQVTSDMGLPVVFETRLPIVTSIRIDFSKDLLLNPNTINLEVDAKIWRHGDYSISVYNPMSDVWHAIRRATATDINLPLKTSITYDPEKDNLKISFPPKPAVAGVLTHAKDCVTVNEDDAEVLKKACPSCNYIEDVTMGIAHKKEFTKKFDSKDTGLEYSMSIFDCENGLTPVSFTAGWYRVFMSERKNDWNDLIVRPLLAVRQQIKNTMISPRMGSCGGIVTIKPSKVHPTSRIDVSLRKSIEDVDHTNPTFHLFSSVKYNIHATVDIVEAPTNAVARSWDLNVNTDMNQGHSISITKIHLTRKTPGEKNLKICIDSKKTYSEVPNDPLRLGITKEETNTKWTIAVERTDNDECARDEMLVTLIMKGTMSDEQKKAFTRDMLNGTCANDIKNPVYASPKNLVPKTLNCLNEAIRYTSLRKYSIKVNHRKLPKGVIASIRHFEDIFRANFLPNVDYTVTNVQPGNLDISVEFPMHTDVVDLSLAAPSYGYDLIDVSFEKPRFNGFGPVIESPWKFPLDNTRFTVRSLSQYTHNILKMCSIYPHIVLTGDGKNVPFTVPNEWTLVSGDHTDQIFAVFAKTVDSNLAIRVYMRNYQVDIVPDGNNNSSVIVDGKLVEKWADGVLVPNNINRWLLKVTKYNDHIIVQMRGIPLTLAHSINHVALAIATTLQGKISGLCGHLDGTYLKGIPVTYTIPNA